MLTGQIKYRLQERLMKKPLIVLQVEETVNVPVNCRSYIDNEERNVWRDAKVEDLFHLGRLK